MPLAAALTDAVIAEAGQHPEATAAELCRDLRDLAGAEHWSRRMADLAGLARPRSWTARAAQRRHALELLLDRLSGPGEAPAPNQAEQAVLALAREAVRLADSLPRAARGRLRDRLLAGLAGEATLIPLFHLLREAGRQRARGFEVYFSGLIDGTPHDLLLRRDGAEAELACLTLSAEAGQPVQHGHWCALMDGINPDLQTWLAAHPGRYLLKMTLPSGLRGPEDVAGLQRQVSALLAAQKRQDHSEAAVLKLDPLVLAGARASAQGLPERLRSLFGPEAHLAVTADPGGGSVFVMAARAGQEDGVAAAAAAALERAVAERLEGRRPGILALFLDDIERHRWLELRQSLALESAVRRIFTRPDVSARLVAASCATRMELFGPSRPNEEDEGELRFRNPAHLAARCEALLPAIRSTV